MTLEEIAYARFSNQQLAGTKIKSAVGLVEWLGAVQGQEYAQTKWGLGLRLPHLFDDDIESDINSGIILRTHLLRPTWHLVAAKDIHWLLNLTAPRVHQANAYMYRQVELDSKVFNRCNDIMIKLLQGGNQLTREKINEAFAEKKIIAKGHRLSYIMMNAELEGIICSGPRQGNQFTYALLDERVTNRKKLKKEEALAELTIRYFQSRGPATIRDFATWSGLTTAVCKTGVEMISSMLQKEVIEGQEFYFNPTTSRTRKRPDRICLLPIYDEFIMGYKDKSAIMTLKGKASFRYDCTIVYNGQIIGTWKRIVSKNTIDLAYDIFISLGKPQRELLDEAINQLGEFMNLKVKRIKTEHKGKLGG
jgi:hypothetical protein